MSFGYAAFLVPQILRHPFGITTQDSTWFTWLQMACLSLGGLGTLYLLALMIRANGRWPWRR
jgi:hypothetical protein